jgi:hypothetical protein
MAQKGLFLPMMMMMISTHIITEGNIQNITKIYHSATHAAHKWKEIYKTSQKYTILQHMLRINEIILRIVNF